MSEVMAVPSRRQSSDEHLSRYMRSMRKYPMLDRDTELVVITNNIFSVNDTTITSSGGNANDDDVNVSFNCFHNNDDLDNNGGVDFADLGLLKDRFFGTDPDADLDGDGNVNFADLQLLENLFFGAPGPSGLLLP